MSKRRVCVSHYRVDLLDHFGQQQTLSRPFDEDYFVGEKHVASTQLHVLLEETNCVAFVVVFQLIPKRSEIFDLQGCAAFIADWNAIQRCLAACLEVANSFESTFGYDVRRVSRDYQLGVPFLRLYVIGDTANEY